MAFQECGKGHIYDTDRYPKCPYCQQNTGSGGFNFNAPAQAAPAEYGATVPLKGRSFDYTPQTPAEYGATVPLSGKSFDYQATTAPQGYTAAPKEPPKSEPKKFEPAPAPEISYYAPHKRETVRDYAPAPAAQKAPAEEKAAPPAQAAGTLPVGWLVCTEGEEAGKDFRILNKCNTVGKSSRADIRLTDNSGNKYAIWARIDYNAEDNVCRLNPIQSGNVYLNGVPVGVPIKLNDKDFIELGGCEYLFVSLCGDKFRWDKLK